MTKKNPFLYTIKRIFFENMKRIVTMEQQRLQQIIQSLGLWKWFQTFEPHPNEGYLNSSSVEVAMIWMNAKQEKFTLDSVERTLRYLRNRP